MVIHQWLYSRVWALAAFLSFIVLYRVRRTPWTGISPLLDHYLHTGQHKHRIDAFMPRVEFEPTTRVRAREDSSCLRPRGHSVRRFWYIY
jgi:hypothetical protein